MGREKGEKRKERQRDTEMWRSIKITFLKESERQREKERKRETERKTERGGEKEQKRERGRECLLILYKPRDQSTSH